jgi:hypothetical protein
MFVSITSSGELTLPRIQDQFLQSVFYLFPTQEDAEKRTKYGGTGFFVSLDSNEFGDELRHVYAVTNKHLLVDSNGKPRCLYLNINNSEGDTDTIITELKHWRLAPDDDLAVLPISPSASRHLASSIGELAFLTEEKIAKHNIGVGDDLFFIGRFVDHQGKTVNTPTLRFGNVALLTEDEIFDNETGMSQVSYLAEARSIKGFSGSPTFVYILPLSPRGRGADLTIDYWQYFIGVVWSHFKTQEEAYGENGERLKVEANSGIMGIVPAKRLLAFLKGDKDLVKHAKKRDDIFRKMKQENSISLDSSDKSLTKQDFEDTLKKVTRKTKPSEPDRPAK